VQLTGAEGALLGIFALDGVEEDFVELHIVAVPVGLAFGEADELVGAPFGEGEVAVGDDVLRACPRETALVKLAEFFDGGSVDRVPGGVRQDGGQVGDGVIEGELEGVVVDRPGADLRRIGDLAGVVGGAVFQQVERACVFSAEGG
jgi:hypothetical protein